LTEARGCAQLYAPKPYVPEGVDYLAAQTSAQWTPGQTIKVMFNGPRGAAGTNADRASLKRAAAEWMRYVNITFEFITTGTPHLRVWYVPGGSWSYVGKECLNIPKSQPTINLGWKNDYARDLHELGHALGFIHEHQSPAADIPWNEPAVYAYYGGAPNFWSPAEVHQQVLGTEDQAGIRNTPWDKHSIMEYPVPAELVTDPAYAVGWNQALSMMDKTFASVIYPKR
jgi:serralysin